jgi:hypothetical protein
MDTLTHGHVRRQVGALCDRGARAVDALEGDLTSVVLACEHVRDTSLFSRVGVQRCGIDTQVAGTYFVHFIVRNSAGLASAVVTRTITVVNTCAMGERLCSNLMDCSIGGVCFEDLEADLRAARVGDEFQSLRLNNPPTISLLTPGGLSAYVNVRRYDSSVVSSYSSARLLQCWSRAVYGGALHSWW